MTKENQTNALGIVPVSEWNNYFEFPTTCSIRKYIRENTNGFKDKVVTKLGNRLYLNVNKFKEWAGVK